MNEATTETLWATHDSPLRAVADRSSRRAARSLLNLGMAVWLLIMTGCGAQPSTVSNSANGDAVPSGGMRTVELQLNWFPDAQHGGFYAAVVNGYYAAEQLDVRIVPGGPTATVIPKVVMGRVAFAIANADQILMARQQEADVVGVFAAMQDSPRCIVVHENSGITKLADLHDVVLAIGDGKAFAEYMKKHLSMPNVRLVSYTGTVGKFMVDENYAQQGYVFSEPLVIRARGGDARALMVSELGFNPYSSVVITSGKLWQGDPELVRRFVKASRRGWESYLRNPDAANAMILGDNSELDATILSESVPVIAPLVLPPGSASASIGRMSPDRWETLDKQLKEISLLPQESHNADGAFINLD